MAVDFISMKAEGKEAKSSVVRIQCLQCGKASTFESCQILLRTFNINFHQDLSYFTKFLGPESGLGYKIRIKYKTLVNLAGFEIQGDNYLLH